MAWDFIDFARQDSTINPERAMVNVLSNINRALHCRVDELIWSLMLRTFSSRERWSFKKKVHILRSLGISVRDVLKRLITDLRNQLEHRYERPKSQIQVQDAMQLGQYFIEATDRYLDGTNGAIRDF